MNKLTFVTIAVIFVITKTESHEKYSPDSCPH